MQVLTACSYNLGVGENDYRRLYHYHYPQFTIRTSQQAEEFRARYKKAQDVAAERLVNQPGPIHVYCLQEVCTEKRVLLQHLTSRKFKTIHITHEDPCAYFDCAVALDQQRFDAIENKSILLQLNQKHCKDIAVAVAIDRACGHKITLASAHMPGFDFNVPKAKIAQEAAEGDVFCQKLIEHLAQIQGCTWQIIGADTNAHPEKWQPRFDLFTQAGFQLLQSHTSTNVNPFGSADKMREIDFFFVKGLSDSSSAPLEHFFNSTCEATRATMLPNPLTFSPDENGSDHLPVVFNIYQASRGVGL